MHSVDPNSGGDALQTSEFGSYLSALWHCGLLTGDQSCRLLQPLLGGQGWHICKQRMRNILPAAERAGYVRSVKAHTLWPALSRPAEMKFVKYGERADFEHLAKEACESLPAEAIWRRITCYLPGDRLKDFVHPDSKRTIGYRQTLQQQLPMADYYRSLSAEIDAEVELQRKTHANSADEFLLPKERIIAAFEESLLTRLVHTSEVYMTLRPHYLRKLNGRFLPRRSRETSGRLLQYIAYPIDDGAVSMNVLVSAEILTAGLNARALEQLWTRAFRSTSFEFRDWTEFGASINGVCRFW